jgi:hypothetical protein
MREVTRVSFGLETTGIGVAVGRENDPKKIEQFRTEIRTENVLVPPTNITIVNGAQVVTIPGGGTVPVNQLTVAQRVALLQ